MTIRQQLIHAATVTRQMAYAPYSDYAVGAAILGGDGKIYTGCNVENASFGLTCCAERNALFSALANGVRHFIAVAIVGGEMGTVANEDCLPCGACRQVLAEFCDDDLEIYFANGQTTLGNLLPEAFRLSPPAAK